MFLLLSKKFRDFVNKRPIFGFIFIVFFTAIIMAIFDIIYSWYRNSGTQTRPLDDLSGM